MDVFPVPDRPTNATVSPVLIVRLRLVNTGALGLDWYVRLTFWKVMQSDGDRDFSPATEIVDFDSPMLEVISIVGFWSCRANTREAAPFARPISGARENI